jgi:PIN domain
MTPLRTRRLLIQGMPRRVKSMTAGDLRATLEAAGTPIGPYDLLIAAQALRTGATLVTANVSEFARVRGLVWQDWTVEGDDRAEVRAAHVRPITDLLRLLLVISPAFEA